MHEALQKGEGQKVFSKAELESETFYRFSGGCFSKAEQNPPIFETRVTSILVTRAFRFLNLPRNEPN